MGSEPPHATQVPAGVRIQRMAPNLRRGVSEEEKTAFEGHPSSPFQAQWAVTYLTARMLA